MITLVFADQNNTINVRYQVDMFDQTSKDLTVMDITGLNAAEKTLGLTFRPLKYTLKTFTDFATANDLKLTMFRHKVGVAPVVLVAHTGQYYNSGLGRDNI